MFRNLEPIKFISRKLFRVGVESVLPHTLVKKSIRREGPHICVMGRQYVLQNNCYIVGFGKAVLGMATELERILKEHLITGIISVPDGILKELHLHEEMMPKRNSVLQIMEGAKNNLPDENAEKAALAIMNLVKDMDKSSILFVAVSGGGSALLPSPVPSINLQDKLLVTKLLANAGANINELNSVRKSLSILKGGGLAVLAYPAQVITLILSDIVNDPIGNIASGPTVVNSDTNQTAQSILNKYALEKQTPANVLDYLKNLQEKEVSVEIPTINNHFTHVYNCLIGNNVTALNSVAESAVKEGCYPIILSSSIEGNVRQVAKLYAIFTIEICKFLLDQHTCKSLIDTVKSASESYNITLQDFENSTEFCPAGCQRICLIMGGETTVEVRGKGIGGRNQELSLAFAHETCEVMKKYPIFENYNIIFLSGGTDGFDGPTKYAGAISYPQQITLAKSRGLDPLLYLNNNDSTNFYLDLNNGEDLLSIGHTGTNVMDLHILIIEKSVI